MHLKFIDPTRPETLGVLLLLFGVVFTVAAPGLALVLLLAFAMASVFAPAIAWLRRKLRLGERNGPTVLMALAALVGMIAFFLYGAVPGVVADIKVAVKQLPATVPEIKAFFRGAVLQLPLPEGVKAFILSKAPALNAEVLQRIAHTLLKGVYGKLLGFAHGMTLLVLWLVFFAFYLAEWPELARRNEARLRHYYPAQAEWLLDFGARFQEKGAKLGQSMLVVGALFGLVLFATFVFAGFSFGKALGAALVLGPISAIPTIGGAITYVAVFFLGFANLGVSKESVSTIFAMYVVLLALHTLEMKVITPKVTGHFLGVTGVYVLAALVAAVYVLGVGKGILVGLMLIIVASVLRDMRLERRTSCPE